MFSYVATYFCYLARVYMHWPQHALKPTQVAESVCFARRASKTSMGIGILHDAGACFHVLVEAVSGAAWIWIKLWSKVNGREFA